MTTATAETRAACLDAPNQNEFFADTGETLGKNPPARARRLTRDYCAFCPIRPECELEGDRRQEPGLWGGYWRRRSPTHGYVKTLAI